MQPKTKRAVLFDLDGTLIDTAPDLAATLNQLRSNHFLPPLPVTTIRPITHLGSKAMLKLAFNVDENDGRFKGLRQEFLALYEHHLTHRTRLFPNAEALLTTLENQGIPWGIVTNKLTHHTKAVLKELGLAHRTQCVVCGDSLTRAKPDPEPILHACWLLTEEPANCLYVGDAITDVTASKAAGVTALVALYGDGSTGTDPYTWQADGYINDLSEVLNWL